MAAHFPPSPSSILPFSINPMCRPDKKMGWQLLAVIVAVATLLTVLFLLCLLIIICIRRRIRHLPPEYLEQPQRTTTTTPETASFDPSLLQLTMPQLIAATNNFDKSRYIGDGGFGVVYRANLVSGSTVAVKKLSPDAFQGIREFRAEIETLAQLRHPNIVKILGYCVSNHDRVLIYEFIERGSLDEWLYETTSSNDPDWPLSWSTRVNVVKGVANGLFYLHGLVRPIVHRDIKAGNVLLDLGFEAHIADFGLARSVEGVDNQKSTQAAGTMGYMPPEYKMGHTAARVEGDVYSFGVLMLEVATGRRPSWDVGLVEWAREVVLEGRFVEALDDGICGAGEDDVAEFFKIAALCTREQPKERPRMGEVIAMLSRIAT